MDALTSFSDQLFLVGDIFARTNRGFRTYKKQTNTVAKKLRLCSTSISSQFKQCKTRLKATLQTLVVKPTTLTGRTSLCDKVSNLSKQLIDRNSSKTYSASGTPSITNPATLTPLSHRATSTTTARRSSRSRRRRRARSRRSGKSRRSRRSTTNAGRVKSSLSWLAVTGGADGSCVAGALGVGGSLGHSAWVDGGAGLNVRRE